MSAVTDLPESLSFVTHCVAFATKDKRVDFNSKTTIPLTNSYSINGKIKAKCWRVSPPQIAEPRLVAQLGAPPFPAVEVASF